MLTTKVIVVYVLKVSRQLNVYVILSNVLDVCILPDGDDVMPALDCECESGLASRSTEVSLAVLGAPKTSCKHAKTRIPESLNMVEWYDKKPMRGPSYCGM